MAADTIRSLFVLWSAWSGEQGLVIGMLERMSRVLVRAPHSVALTIRSVEPTWVILVPPPSLSHLFFVAYM